MKNLHPLMEGLNQNMVLELMFGNYLNFILLKKELTTMFVAHMLLLECEAL